MPLIGRLLLGSLVSAFLCLQADAETWPTKPLRVIVPIGAGSSVDLVARIISEQLSDQLGQPLIVENRPGAGQTLGAAAVAKAEPDGYTLLVNSSAHTIGPALYPNAGYHPARDFIAVAPLGATPFVLVVPPERGFTTAARPRQCGERAARLIQLFLAGGRKWIAFERRAVSRGDRRSGDPRSVQRGRRGDDRSDGGPHRLFLCRARTGSAAYTGKEAHRPCGEWGAALPDATERTDNRGSRICESSQSNLVRPIPARANTA